MFIQSFPELIGQILMGDMEHQKDSELHRNQWSETFSWRGDNTKYKKESTRTGETTCSLFLMLQKMP